MLVPLVLLLLDLARDRGVFCWTRHDLTGRLVVITGAAGGLGRQLALEFAMRGAVLALWDVRKDALHTCVEWLEACGVPRSSVHVFVVDVADAAAVRATAQSQLATLGPASVVVSNAAVVNGEPLLQASEERLRASFAINALSHVWLARALVPQLATSPMGANVAKPGGVFVTIGSLMAELPAAGLVDYCASKAAVRQLHECLRWEQPGRGDGGDVGGPTGRSVHCLHVQPYMIDTPLFAGGQPGRFRWVRALLPPLGAATVARRIADAVETRRDRIVIPYILKWLPPLLQLLPDVVRDVALDLAGAECAMNRFVGGAARAVCLDDGSAAAVPPPRRLAHTSPRPARSPSRSPAVHARSRPTAARGRRA